MIIALGTRCLPGYGRGAASAQHQDLNELIVSIRKFCESRGIPFIDQDDGSLPAAIDARRSKEGFQDARVIVLADIAAIGKELAAMQGDEKAFLVGIDDKNLTPESYIPIVEMLRLALKLSADPAAELNSRSVELKRSGKFWVLIPYAAIKDYDELRRIYAIQKFA